MGENKKQSKPGEKTTSKEALPPVTVDLGEAVDPFERVQKRTVAIPTEESPTEAKEQINAVVKR